MHHCAASLITNGSLGLELSFRPVLVMAQAATPETGGACLPIAHMARLYKHQAGPCKEYAEAGGKLTPEEAQALVSYQPDRMERLCFLAQGRLNPT